MKPPFSRPYCYEDDQVAISDCGIPDCSFNACPSRSFECINGQCISENKVCDGVADCSFREDEVECESRLTIDFTSSVEITVPGVYSFSSQEVNSIDFNFQPVTNDQLVVLKIISITGDSSTCVKLNDVTSCQLDNPDLGMFHYPKTDSNYELGKPLSVKIETGSPSETKILLDFRSTECVFNTTDSYVGYANTIETINSTTSILKDDLCLWFVQPNFAEYDLTMESGYLRWTKEVHNCPIDPLTFEPFCSNGVQCVDSLTLQSDSETLKFKDLATGELVESVCADDIIENFELVNQANLNHSIITVVYLSNDLNLFDETTFNGSNVRQIRPTCCDWDCDTNYNCVDCAKVDESPNFSLVFEDSSLETVQSRYQPRSSTSHSSTSPVCEEWTEWMSASTPSGITLGGKTVSGGEYETFTRLRKKYTFCDAEEIVAIDCRVKSTGVHWTLSDQESLICSKKSGLSCNNRAQQGKCFDYEVRFYCACNKEASFNAGSGALMLQKPSARVPEVIIELTCVPGWTDWFDNSDGRWERIEDLKSTVGSCHNPLSIECSVSGDPEAELHELDQSGYKAKYTCNLDMGMYCDQQAPCKPCKNAQVRLYCPCSTETLWPEKIAIAPELPTTLNPLAYIECCTNADCTSTEICYGSCWRTYNFEVQLEGEIIITSNKWGCESTTCTTNYQDLACYFSNARQTGLICSQCCGGLEYNAGVIDEFKQKESQYCNAPDNNFALQLKWAIEKKIDPVFGGDERSGRTGFIIVFLLTWLVNDL